MQQSRFEIKETSDVAEASRFIMDPSSSKRLVLIDDPLEQHILFQMHYMLFNNLNPC